jgi:hypothetical protein
MAATPKTDEHMIFKGDLEQITALRLTHDPLWIESADGVAVVMMEKDNPKRDRIVATFAERLESRWQGDQLTMAEAAMRLFKMPAGPGRSGIPKVAIIAAIGMAVMFIIGLVVAHMAH